MENVEDMLVMFGLQANAGLQEGITDSAELDLATVHAEEEEENEEEEP